MANTQTTGTGPLRAGRGKRIFLLAVVPAVIQMTAFVVGLYILRDERERERDPNSLNYGSPGYDMVDECFTVIGSSREKAGHPQFAFCQCYAREALRQEVAPEDQALLLQAIEREGLGRPAAAESKAAQSHYPQHLQSFMSSALPVCQAKYEKFAAYERRSLAHD